MTPVVLLVLAILWAAVLVPGILKKRGERRSAASIDSFHRELHLLERTGPKIVSPAYRLETAEASEAAVGATGLPAITSRPGRPKLVLVGRGTDEEEMVTAEAPAQAEAAAVQADAMEAAPDEATGRFREAEAARAAERRADREAYQRKQVLKRRRDIFLALVATFVLTGLLGMVHSLRLLWALTLVSAIALAGFVMLMSHARRVNMERLEAQRARRLANLDVASRSVAAEDLAWYREVAGARDGGRWDAPSRSGAWNGHDPDEIQVLGSYVEQRQLVGAH